MALNLDDIATDPTNRKAVMTGINKSNKNLVESAQERQVQVSSSMQVLNEISTNAEVEKAVYQKQTSQQLDEMMQGYNVELKQASNQFLQTSALLRSQDQELAALNAQANDPKLPSAERRKAKKAYDQLNEEAFTTQQRRNNVATNIQNLAVGRETIAKEYLSQRTNQQQSQFDIESYTQMVRLENLTKNLQLEQEFENIQAGLVNQLRTFGADEANALKQENSGVMEFLWAVNNDFDPQAMNNFNRDARVQMGAQLNLLSKQEQEELAPLIGVWQRLKQSGEDISKNDFIGVVVQSGKIGTLERVAELSGDGQLQDAIRLGKEPYQRRLVDQLVQQFEEDRAVAPTPADMKAINAQAQDIVNDSYARDIIGASKTQATRTASAEASGAGQAIYSPEHLEQILDANAYSKEVMDVVGGQEFKDAIAQIGSDSGNEVLSASERAFQVMEKSGFNTEGKRAQAYRVIADINKKSAMRYLREKDTNSSSDLDYYNSLGFPTDEGLLQMEIPRNIARLVQGEAELKIKPIYDLSEASDLMAALEILKSYREIRERRSSAANRGRFDVQQSQFLGQRVAP